MNDMYGCLLCRRNSYEKAVLLLRSTSTNHRTRLPSLETQMQGLPLIEEQSLRTLGTVCAGI